MGSDGEQIINEIILKLAVFFFASNRTFFKLNIASGSSSSL